MRSQVLGFTDANLNKLPLGLKALAGLSAETLAQAGASAGLDTDQDGLPDALEQALGTSPTQPDTDADGFNDYLELTTNNSPKEKNKKLIFDKTLAKKFLGRILLQVQNRGQAWYVYPVDQKRYFLSRPADAFNLMRYLGLGVSEKDYGGMGGK